MSVNPRAPIFAFLSPYLKSPGWGNRELLEGMDKHLDLLGVPRAGEVVETPCAPADPLTMRVALEIIGHEAIVQEAYKDSVGVWTWSVGITDASGHDVYPRYKDNPQTVQRCIEVFLWVLRSRYVPAVLKAFKGRPLTEAQFAAALSFHYNTGAILKARWVTMWLDGADGSREQIMDWRSPPEIIPRREKERDLFFKGIWSNDGTATVYPVKKPSYRPDFAHPGRIDVRPMLEELL